MQKFFLFTISLVISMGWLGCKSQPNISSTSNDSRDYTNMKSHDERMVDSTLIDHLREVIVRNDTVFVRDSIYIFKWRDHHVRDTVRDTLYVSHTDSIRIPVEVEKPIAPFVRNSCIALWVMIGVAILALIGWMVYGFATGKFSWIKIAGKLFGL